MNLILKIVLLIGTALVFNEFLVYYVVFLSQCRWPSKLNDSVKAMLLADTHLLGPHNGHWFDKLRREWQMHRAFQTSVWLYQPDVIFILGDIFDEGQWVDEDSFKAYVRRFNQLFHTPSHIQVFSAAGNHDIGFHYRLHPYISERFRNAFNESNNSLITIKENHFVLLNSMTLSRDGCYFCAEAEAEIRRISHRLNCAKPQSQSNACKNMSDKLDFYTKPVILQHFPTYRKSDEACEEHDSPKIEKYRANWEVLSKDATKFLGKSLNPMVAFSGHSHHYCRSFNMWNVAEFTIASFSWRNKKNPSFLLAEFSGDNYAVSKCDMPNEDTVVFIYILTGIAVLLTISYSIIFKYWPRKGFKPDNKKN